MLVDSRKAARTDIRPVPCVRAKWKIQAIRSSGHEIKYNNEETLSLHI